MIDAKRLNVLTESAKYDVSCSSSGSSRKNTTGGIGNAAISGICHSFTQDGRCISLLKILLTNSCIYNCQYCINRSSNDIPRAMATPEEICELVLNFYKRNYIEGLFLSSAIYRSPDYTMELLLEVVTKLRKTYKFNGYIHLKGIPNADYLLILKAGALVDRMSFNIELPTEKSLKLLAPQKSKQSIITPMKNVAIEYCEHKKEKSNLFLPAGQTTQMIVGASPENDGQILKLSEALYNNYKLKRVYYSSYIPTNLNNKLLPASPIGLLREHRLYQADWLMRFYGFTSSEIISENENLSTEYDPKCAGALKNMWFFPVEINTAPPERLIRVPGIGFKSASKIVLARRHGKLSFEDLQKMRVVLKRAVHFITVNGKFYGEENLKRISNALTLYESSKNIEQISLFSHPEVNKSILTGEL